MGAYEGCILRPIIKLQICVLCPKNKKYVSLKTCQKCKHFISLNSSIMEYLNQVLCLYPDVLECDQNNGY